VHTRSRSDIAGGFTAPLVYAALSGLGVVIFYPQRTQRRAQRPQRVASWVILVLKLVLDISLPSLTLHNKIMGRGAAARLSTIFNTINH
jgi:hypothetical protein